MEEELAARAALDSFLSEHGYDVTTASDADEAIALLAAGLAYHALVVDLVGSGADGRKVITFARGQLGRGSVWILALVSGHDERVEGADAVLGKPVEFDVLLERLSELLGDRAATARPKSAGAIAKLMAQVEANRDDSHGSVRAAIAKLHQRDGNNEEAAFWFMCAGEYAQTRGDPKAAASWRTLANLIAPAGSHPRLARRKLR